MPPGKASVFQSGVQVQISVVSIYCVFEQDTLYSLPTSTQVTDEYQTGTPA